MARSRTAAPGPDAGRAVPHHDTRPTRKDAVPHHGTRPGCGQRGPAPRHPTHTQRRDSTPRHPTHTPKTRFHTTAPDPDAGGAQPSSLATYFRHSAVNSVRLTPTTFASADSTAPERSGALPTVR